MGLGMSNISGPENCYERRDVHFDNDHYHIHAYLYFINNRTQYTSVHRLSIIKLLHCHRVLCTRVASQVILLADSLDKPILAWY